MHRKKRLLLLVATSLLFASFAVSAQNNKNLTITGKLNDIDGNPIGNNNPVTYDVSVRLYNDSTGGELLYLEDFLITHAQGIRIEKGQMNITLGSGTTDDNLAVAIQNNNNLWVELTVDGDRLSRSPLSATPFAISHTPNTTNVSIRSNK